MSLIGFVRFFFSLGSSVLGFRIAMLAARALLFYVEISTDCLFCFFKNIIILNQLVLKGNLILRGPAFFVWGKLSV